jgi:hypothetical protein
LKERTEEPKAHPEGSDQQGQEKHNAGDRVRFLHA